MMGRSQMDQGGCYNDNTNMLKTFEKSLYYVLETFFKWNLMTGMRLESYLSPHCFSASVVTLTSLSAGVRLLRFLLFKFSD